MKTKSTLRKFILLAGSSLLAASSASAADGTWDTDSAGNWTDTTKWLGDAAYAVDADSTATFGNFIAGDRIITLDAPITIGNITASDTSHNYTISGANILTLDRSSGTPTINVTTSTRTLSISSQISGADGLQKIGAGALTLQGANDYTGITSIYGISSNSGSNPVVITPTGSIAVSGASGALGGTDAIDLISGGTLRLINTITQSAVNRVADSATLGAISGGTFSFENTATSAAVAYAESLGTISPTSGQLNLVLLNNQTPTDNTQTLTFGGLTRIGASNFSAVTFSATGTGPQAAGNKNMIVVSGVTSSTDTDKIIGAWATTGNTASAQTDYAIYTSDGTNGYITPRAATSTTDEGSGWSTVWADTSNYAWGNTTLGLTTGGARNINTLRHTGGAETLTLGGNLGTYGILNGGTGALTISGNNVTLPVSGAGSLNVTAGSNVIVMDSPIVDNGGALTLVKSGSGGTFANNNISTRGTLVLKGVNTYTGDTIINGGTLQVGANNGGKLGDSSGVYSGNISINSGGMLYVASSGTQILSGTISGDGSVMKSYGGTLTLSGNNTYTGKTSMAPTANGAGSGTLQVYSLNSVNGGTPLMASSSLGAPTTVANGTIDLGGPGNVQGSAAFRYLGAGETTDRVVNIQFGANASRTLDASGSGLLKFTSAMTSGGNFGGPNGFTLTGPGSGEITQNLPALTTSTSGAALSKTGTGTWTLGGNHTGSTNVSNGLLRFNNATSQTITNTNNSSIAALVVSSTGGIDLRSGGVNTLNIAANTTPGTGGGNFSITGAAGANNLYFDLGTTSADTIAAADAFSMTTSGAGVINLNQIGAPGTRIATGTYDLITAASGITATGTQFQLATTSAFGQTFSLADTTTTALKLTATQVTSVTPAAFWAGDADANWSAANWKTDATANTAALPPDFGTNVTFQTTTPVAGNLSTTVDVDSDINSLNFSADATSDVTIGGTKMLVIEATNANGNTAGNGITVSTPSSGTPAHTISAKVGLASSQTWTVATGAALGVSGVVSDFGGAFSLTKAGDGTLTLSGGRTYTGATNVNGGTLAISAGTFSIASAINIASGATLTTSVNNTFSGGTSTQGAAWTIAGTITGTASAQTMPSSVTLNNGMMNGAGSGAFGTYLVHSAGTTITANGNSNTISGGSIGMSNISTLTLHTPTGTDTLSVSNALGQSSALAGALKKTGLGTVSLSGTNTYTGTTTVNLGTLSLVGGSHASPMIVNSGATLGFTISSATTSTASVTFNAGHKVAVSGTVDNSSDYQLMTASSFSGTPTLDPAISGYALELRNSGTELWLDFTGGGPVGFAAWQAANGGTSGGLGDDHDNDGVDNGTEFFLGGTNDTTGFTSLPSVVKALDGTLSVTWVRHPDFPGFPGNYGTDVVVETSATLTGTWNPESSPGNVTITGNNVKYTFPGGPPYTGKNFARLRVTGP